jgi:hypothetical protein
MGAFDDVHRGRITGSLAMYDRVIFKGYLSGLFGGDRVRTFLWSQGVSMVDFTAYARSRRSASPTTSARSSPTRAVRSSRSTMSRPETWPTPRMRWPNGSRPTTV